MDPDPGGPKTCGSGSATLVKTLKFFDADTGSGMEKLRIRDGKIRDLEKHS